jgi:hypothetical protein
VIGPTLPAVVSRSVPIHEACADVKRLAANARSFVAIAKKHAMDVASRERWDVLRDIRTSGKGV